MITKKEQMVGTRLPESFIVDLEKIETVEQSDRSTVLRKLLYRALKDWKMEYYAQEYGQERMTLGRAAEEAGVSVWEMMEYIRQRKIAMQYSLEDLEHDLKVIESSKDKRSRPRPVT
jgi:predicted HTH domain antitoxin